MLSKDNIYKINILSEDWIKGRLGKFTSSEISALTGKDFLTQGCLSYIYRKVGEKMSGKAAIGEITTEYTVHGLIHEAAAVRKFAQKKGLEWIVCQQLITSPTSRFGSTPDGIIVLNQSLDGTMYNVETVEVKCPPTYASYVGLALCKTPQDVKAENKQYYWQVLDQMLNCDCMKAYFVVYHPDFKLGNMNIVEFRKMQPEGIEGGKPVSYPLVRDLKFLEERKAMAVQKMDEIYEQISLLGAA
jgi:hypothetical protein